LVFTIDNEGTRSYDDALSIEKIESNDDHNFPVYKVYIHISEVARLIKPGTLIDSEA
jgi:exoribonuclease R